MTLKIPNKCAMLIFTKEFNVNVQNKIKVRVFVIIGKIIID